MNLAEKLHNDIPLNQQAYTYAVILCTFISISMTLFHWHGMTKDMAFPFGDISYFDGRHKWPTER